MKAVLHFRAGPELRRRVRSLAEMEVVIVDETDDAAFRREIVDAEVLLHVLKPVTADMMAAAPRLRLIQKIGVGLNTIDREAAAARGIKVANMPGTNSQAVAEQTLMLMLAVLRQVVTYDSATRRGHGWLLEPQVLERSGEISGRTVGLVGFGAVPRRLEPVLQALGATVIYNDRIRAQNRSDEFRSLERLVAESDIISLHIPLTQDTHGMFGSRMFGQMKRGSILINTARGELIDEPALAAALADGQLAGAGLDVFASEPVSKENPLLQLSNVIVTPHVSWLTTETIVRSFSVVTENAKRLQRGTPLLYEVPLEPAQTGEKA